MKPVYRVKAQSRPMLTVVDCKPLADPDMLSMLGQFQQLAADGHIAGMAIAAARIDGGIATAYVKGERLFPLIGAVRAIGVRLEREIIG